jgi:glycosyltransferase involved in cell wall biosynthesis
MTVLRVATGIDIPMAPSCGSMILCSDIYGGLRGQLDATFLAMPPRDQGWDDGFVDSSLLRTPKRPYGNEFDAYVDELVNELDPLLATIAPDLVHAQHLGFGLSTAFSRMSLDIPVIAIGHGTDVIAARTSLQALQALRDVVAASVLVILPTASIQAEVDAMTEGRFTNRLHLVPWGIPLDAVAEVHHPRPGDQLHLLYSGRLDVNKSAITAVESLQYTRAEHQLTVIGSGETYETLRHAVTGWSLESRVTFEPFMPRPQLWRRFADFDALLFTTSEVEAFGLVAIEAQAHGLPVIYSAVEGVADAVGDSGLTYQPASAMALAGRIDELASDVSLRAHLSALSLANAARYPVAATRSGLLSLTRQAVRGSHV